MAGDQAANTLFSCVDPLGRSIVARRRWDEHIRAWHPEMTPHIEAVRATLEAPDAIVSDIDNPDGLNDYRFGVLPPPFDRLYLNVVVTFRRGEAIVISDGITACPTGKIARGEVRRWP